MLNDMQIQTFFDRFVVRTDGYFLSAGQGTSIYPAKNEPFTLKQVRDHIHGMITIGLPAADSEGYCKWFAFDDDTIVAPGVEGYLDRIDRHLKSEGFTTLREGARPAEGGTKQGHLWILFDTMLESRIARAWSRSVLNKLNIPLTDRKLEQFPKNDRPNENKLGSNLRAPLAMHPKVPGLRCWFAGVPEDLQTQLEWFAEQPLNNIEKVVADGNWQLELEAARSRYSGIYICRVSSQGEREKRSVLEAVKKSGAKLRKSGNWYCARCPLCAQEGHDRSCSNLAIHKDGAFKCHSGHGTKEIFRYYFGGR